MLISLGLGFYFSWIFSLISFAFLPALMLGSVMAMKYDPAIGTAF